MGGLLAYEVRHKKYRIPRNLTGLLLKMKHWCNLNPNPRKEIHYSEAL